MVMRLSLLFLAAAQDEDNPDRIPGTERDVKGRFFDPGKWNGYGHGVYGGGTANHWAGGGNARYEETPDGTPRKLVVPGWDHRRRGKKDSNSRSEGDGINDLAYIENINKQAMRTMEEVNKKLLDEHQSGQEIKRMNELLSDDGTMFFEKLKNRVKEVDESVTRALTNWNTQHQKLHQTSKGLLIATAGLAKDQARSWRTSIKRWTNDLSQHEKTMLADLNAVFAPATEDVAGGEMYMLVHGLAAKVDKDYQRAYTSFDNLIEDSGEKLTREGNKLVKLMTNKGGFNDKAAEYVTYMTNVKNQVEQVAKGLRLDQISFNQELRAADKEIVTMGTAAVDHVQRVRARTLKMYVNWLEGSERIVDARNNAALKELENVEIDALANIRTMQKDGKLERRDTEKSIKGWLKSGWRMMKSYSKSIFKNAKTLAKAAQNGERSRKKHEDVLRVLNAASKEGVKSSTEGTELLVSDLRTLQQELEQQVSLGVIKKGADVEYQNRENQMQGNVQWGKVLETVERSLKEEDAKVAGTEKKIEGQISDDSRTLKAKDITLRSDEQNVGKQMASIDGHAVSVEEKIKEGYTSGIAGLKKVDVSAASLESEAAAYQVKLQGKLKKGLMTAESLATQQEKDARERSALYDEGVMKQVKDDFNGQLDHVGGHVAALKRLLEADTTKDRIGRTATLLADTSKKFDEVSADLADTQKEGAQRLKRFVEKDLVNLESTGAEKAMAHLTPVEEQAERMVASAEEQGHIAIQQNDAKVQGDVTVLSDATRAAGELWRDEDHDLKGKDRLLGDKVEASSSRLGDSMNDHAAEQTEIRNQLDVAQTNAGRMYANEQEAVNSAYSAAKEKVDAAKDDALSEERKMEADADVVTSRQVRLAEEDEKERTNVLHGHLNALKDAQHEMVDSINEKSGEMAAWISRFAGVEGDDIEKFVANFDALQSSSNEMLLSLERGSAEEAAFIKSKGIMMEKLMAGVMDHLTEDEKKEMKEAIKLMEEEIHSSMRTVGMTKEERLEALAEIQKKCKDKLMGIMGKSDKLAPMVKQFSADQHAHEQAQLDLANLDADDLARVGPLQRQAQKAAMQDYKKHQAGKELQLLMGTVQVAQDGQASKMTELRTEDDLDRAAAASANEAATSSLGGVFEDANAADQAAAEIQAQEEAQAKWQQQVLGQSTQFIGDLRVATTGERTKVAAAIQAEKHRMKMGALYAEESRKQVLEQLTDLLGDAQDVSTDLFVQRSAAVEHLNTHIEDSLKMLEENGHSELATMMKNSLQFSKQMLRQLADLKLAMWDDHKLNGGTKGDAAFAKLRKKLTDFQKKSAAESGALVAQLESRLHKMGVVGGNNAEHLASFLHQLSFQLANGQADGLEHLVGEIFDQFGLALGSGIEAGSLLGGTLQALEMKQRAATDMLAGGEKALSRTEGKFETIRGKVLGMLSNDKQLASISDEEMRARIRELRALLGGVSSGEASAQALHDPGSALEVSSAGTLKERVAEESEHRAAALAKQHELEQRLKAVIEKHAAKPRP